MKPTGTGRIQPGQTVRLLYDAFPYQRYGIKHGTVRWVSPAAVTIKDRQVFRVLVELEEHAVAVKKGETRQLMAGMGGRADVIVGRRSLHRLCLRADPGVAGDPLRASPHAPLRWRSYHAARASEEPGSGASPAAAGSSAGRFIGCRGARSGPLLAHPSLGVRF